MKNKLSGIRLLNLNSPAGSWISCAAILLAATLGCQALARAGLAAGNAGALMALAVFAVSASTQGYKYGLASAVIGAFIYEYLVTEPRLQINISLDFALTLGIMLLISLATGAVMNGMRIKYRAALEAEQRVELMYKINDLLLSAADERAIAQSCLSHLSGALGRAVSMHFSGGGGLQPGTYFSGEQAKDRPLPRESGSDAHFIPLSFQNKAYGVAEISLAKGPLSPDELSLAQAVSRQAAQALHLLALSVQRQQARLDAEAEKARSRFLRGISHDLRTPLTAIIGASNTLLDSGGQLPEATGSKLIYDIQSDAQWLLDMVENILSVTRLQGDAGINKSEEAAEEIVGEAVARFRRRHPQVKVEVRQNSGLLLVPMDATLVSRALGNLLDNAARYAGAAASVTIDITRENGFASFTVSDNGPGIASSVMPRLFAAEASYGSSSQDAARGHGMGLLICKTIAEAHGGRISAYNLPEGGASFAFSLPFGTEVYSNGK